MVCREAWSALLSRPIKELRAPMSSAVERGAYNPALILVIEQHETSSLIIDPVRDSPAASGIASESSGHTLGTGEVGDDRRN